MIAPLFAAVLGASDAVAVGADFTDGRVCSRVGWCWELPRPQGTPLSAFWGSGPRDVWAAGDSGTLIHFDGTTWSGRVDLVEVSLHALWGSGPRDVWAAGGAGTLLRFDGETWRRVPSGSDEDLRAVTGSSRQDVWAVGGRAALHFDGARWSSVPLPPNARLWSVWREGSDVFAQGGGLFRFDGRAFVEVQALDPGDPVPVAGPARTKFALRGGRLLKRAGEQWVGAGVATLERIERGWFPSSSLAWLVTMERGSLRYDGRDWKRYPLPEFATVIWERTPNDAWAATLFGVPMHFDGKRWTAPDQPCARFDGRMLAVADGEVWLGSHEQLCHRGAQGWEQVPTRFDTTPSAIAGTRSDDIWIATSTNLYHWNGEFLGDARQTPGRMPADNFWGLTRLWLDTRRSGWAVGERGLVLFWDSQRWTRVPSGTSAALRAAWSDGAGATWVVGAGGTALRWAGSSFESIRTPPMGKGGRHQVRHDLWIEIGPGAPGDLVAISGAAPDDIWAAGGPESAQQIICGTRAGPEPTPVDWGAALIHWDGKAWSAVPTGEVVYLHDVWARARDDVWAVGADVLMHFDGRAWSKQTLSRSPLERSGAVLLGGTKTELFILGDRTLRVLPLVPR